MAKKLNLFLCADRIRLHQRRTFFAAGHQHQNRQHNFEEPFFIAGGLTVDNVAEAQSLFTPYAVDVSSGVETNGQKDVEKIKAFIERVKL